MNELFIFLLNNTHLNCIGSIIGMKEEMQKKKEIELEKNSSKNNEEDSSSNKNEDETNTDNGIKSEHSNDISIDKNGT